MGRFGMGHGALAIRDRRRRHSRLSVTGVGYQPQQHCENYMVFAQRSQRKNSVTSSQSVPVKGGPASADVAAVGDVAVSIPGQLLTSSDFPKTLSLPEVTDGPVPGPSWWPGPPFQQGGIVRSNTMGIVPGLLPQQAADDQLTRGKLGLLSDIFNGNRWNYFQERLMPRLKGAVMPFHPDTPLHQDTSAITSHHLTFDQELPNGKSAWGGRGGGQKKVSEAQKRWVSKNKVGDTAGGSLEKRADGRYRQTGVVNIVLYVGLGLFALGLIITFIGMGEHGFKSQELQLIGPSLIGCGFLFCLLRLFFCSTPACCTVCCKKGTSLDEKALLSPSRETLTEDTTEVQQRQQQEPQRLPQLQKITNQLVRNKHRTKKKKEQEEQEVQKVLVVPSNIPNFIEDEGDEDEDLGLKVEYIDEVGQEATPRRNLEPFASNSRPASSHSHNSTASKVSKIDGHSITRQNSEILLDPATLERPEG